MNQFKMTFRMLAAVSSLAAFAVDVPTELEKPGMDEDTAAVIQAFATGTLASRTYTTYGKVNITDSVWIKVNDNAELYRFFKVTVDLK